MSPGDLEPALRVRIAQLEAELATKNEQLNAMKERLDAVGVHHGAPEGSTDLVTRRPTSPAAGAEVRHIERGGLIFPNEIFLMISEYLSPGTRSLLSLARTCRALYELSLPRLYVAFSLRNVINKARRTILTGPRVPSLSHGLNAVKTTRYGKCKFERPRLRGPHPAMLGLDDGIDM